MQFDTFRNEANIKLKAVNKKLKHKNNTSSGFPPFSVQEWGGVHAYLHMVYTEAYHVWVEPWRLGGLSLSGIIYNPRVLFQL